MEAARSPRIFADQAARLLASARDMHIWLKVGDETVGAFKRSVAPNGSSGNPLPHDLGNGVVAFLPSWKDLRPDGSCLEGEGIVPDIQASYVRGDGNSDAVLDAARAFLRKP